MLPDSPKQLNEFKWVELNEAIEEMRALFAQTSLANRMTDAQVEIVYGFAYDMHMQGKFDMAIKLLKLILMYRPFDSRFLLAMGLNLKRNSNFSDAIQFFTASMALSNGDPTPAIHIAECLTALGDLESSASMLDPLIRLSSLDTAYSSLQKRAESLRELINGYGESKDAGN
jgi:Flp pilus assembly protein TadD